MNWTLDPGLAGKIRKKYEAAMAVYPAKKAEVDRFCVRLNETEAGCLQFLYAFMPVSDIVSYEAEQIFHYVLATLAMCTQVDYVKDIPQALLLTYVLSCRVNNEHLDGSRGALFAALYPRIQGKTMTEAALEVNYWCCEKAAYTPTDERTMAPLAMMKAARGRCGEESTFTVSALRSVGIPARQCYCPRWAHCDDNHAWVELWADGGWHYLGACEPEPVLDKGWFTAAASKAMLVHSKAFSHFLPGQDTAFQTPVYSLINSTPAYGLCKTVTVQILDGGRPRENVEVRFQLVNYSELYTIFRAPTGPDGTVRFTTGLGDLYVCAQDRGRVAGRKLDVRQDEALVLDLNGGIRPEALRAPLTEDFELNPPKETLGGASSVAGRTAHEARFRACGEIRRSYEKTFSSDGLLALARGNQGEIRAFLEDSRFDRADKLQLLSTLRDKDFIDTDEATLASYLEAALPYKGRFPEDVYVSSLLAPRIADEMIAPTRAKIAEKLQPAHLTGGQQVWDYLRAHIQILPDYGVDNYTADPWGMLRYGMGPEASFPVLFVAACRSLGIPARLNPVTAAPEYALETGEYLAVSDGGAPEHGARARLTLVNQADGPLTYGFQFSLAQWKNGDYQTLSHFGLELTDPVTWELAQGSYRLLTAARQIDGSVSVRTTCFNLTEDRVLPVTLCPDRTSEKLRRVPLPDAPLQEGLSLKEAMGPGSGVIIFADPGMEPTEHLLRELLECKDAYNAAGHRILLLLSRPSENATLRQVLQELDQAEVYHLNDDAYLHRLHMDLEVGDERLPFAIAADKDKNGLFAFANYNIRTAQTILNILNGR